MYGFVLALTGFQDAWKLAFSSEASGTLVQSILDASLATPFTALFCGIVITSLVQSSSASIALVVATVASGVITVGDSVYILMGANIGTTITNTIVGLAHSHRREEFDRLVPAILVDDVFKIINVTVFFILEVATGFLHGASIKIVDYISEQTLMGGILDRFPDLIDLITAAPATSVITAITSLEVSVGLQALIVGVAFFLLLIASLTLMAEVLEHLLHDRSRELIDRVFAGKPASFGIGLLICWLLQSSSVTVSLILPLVSHSALSLPSVYYYSIGAAVATTFDPTQLLSYMKFGPVGLTAGLVHILMNLIGAAIFVFVPGINRVPLIATRRIAELICRGRHGPAVLITYVAALFFGIPLLAIFAVGALLS